LGAAERGHCIFWSVQSRQRVAHIIVGAGIVRVQSQSPVITGHRTLHVAQGLQGESMMGMIGRLAVVDGNGLGDKLLGGLSLALLQGNHAQQVQRIRAIRMDGQDLAVESGSLFQLSGLVQPYRLGEQASTIKAGQACAFPGQLLRICSAPQHVDGAILANLVAAEALSGADRLAYIDFV
jgi:hypothetical protein